MLKNSLFLLLLLTGLCASAQKIEVRDDVIALDGRPYAGIEADGCGLLDPQCQYFLTPVGSEKRLFVVKLLSFEDLAQRDDADPDGTVRYLQFVFTAAGTMAEIPCPFVVRLRPLDVARKVIKARLLRDGTLDPQAVADFVTNNGTPFSDRRRALNAAPAIIINAPSRY